MNAEHLSEKLAAIVWDLDSVAGWSDDSETAGAVSHAASELHALKLEIERSARLSAQRVPA
jgi:hypothetical protein